MYWLWLSDRQYIATSGGKKVLTTRPFKLPGAYFNSRSRSCKQLTIQLNILILSEIMHKMYLFLAPDTLKIWTKYELWRRNLTQALSPPNPLADLSILQLRVSVVLSSCNINIRHCSAPPCICHSTRHSHVYMLHAGFKIIFAQIDNSPPPPSPLFKWISAVLIFLDIISVMFTL